MRRRFTIALALARDLPASWIWFRIRHRLAQATGSVERRSPIGPWTAIETAPPVVPLWQIPAAAIGVGVLPIADDVLRGRFTLFSIHRMELGVPPDWGRNPFTGETPPRAVHWSKIQQFAYGDIKAIWELNRFGWAFALGRAYAASGDERYAEGFWRLFGDWLRRNPPNTGVAWACAQEATFRLWAATFAVGTMRLSPATTPERLRDFGRLAESTARRIEANFAYALSQRNNHGISESVGLLTCASLLPDSNRSPVRRRHALRELERQLAELVYSDGGFSQHSSVYHRVLLDDLAWCHRVLTQDGIAVPSGVRNAARRATAFLGQLTDPETGSAPLYGANDGAQILPMSDCGYADFRPTLQASSALWLGGGILAPGPWDETAHWLVGAPGQRGASSPPETRFFAPDAGCLRWSSAATRVFLRCPRRFRHRPSQADLLHVSVDWMGLPVAIDAGTYSYNAPQQFPSALASAAVHNSVTFDGQEPMARVSRFLFAPWPRGSAGWNASRDEFSASHDAWGGRGLRHARRISWPTPDTVQIQDLATCRGHHRFRVHWLLQDWPFTFDPSGGWLRLVTPRGPYRISWQPMPGQDVELKRAVSGSERGWKSVYYLHCEPALSLTIEAAVTGRLAFVTTFAPDSAA